MVSTRLELFENVLRVDKPTCSDVSVRLAQSFVECRAVCIIELAFLGGRKRIDTAFESVVCYES